MKLLVVLLMFLLSDGVLMAPVRDLESHRRNSNDDDSIQEDVDDTLWESLILQNDDTLKKVRTIFTLQPSEVKLCIRINYSLKCSDQKCQITNVDCSDGYNLTLIWTSLDPSSLSGSFLLEYASLNWEFFGFEWGRACDITTESTKLLTIEVSSLQMLCPVDDGSKYVNESLKTLTKKVSQEYNLPHSVPD